MKTGKVYVPDGAKIIGVKMTPEYIAGQFREGFVTIITRYIPDEFKVASYGFDSHTNYFYVLYKTEDCPEGAIVEWVDVECYRPHKKVVDEILERVE